MTNHTKKVAPLDSFFASTRIGLLSPAIANDLGKTFEMNFGTITNSKEGRNNSPHDAAAA